MPHHSISTVKIMVLKCFGQEHCQVQGQKWKSQKDKHLRWINDLWQVCKSYFFIFCFQSARDFSYLFNVDLKRSSPRFFIPWQKKHEGKPRSQHYWRDHLDREQNKTQPTCPSRSLEHYSWKLLKEMTQKKAYLRQSKVCWYALSVCYILCLHVCTRWSREEWNSNTFGIQRTTIT